ncbi:HAD-IIB family hydrolase [Falsirhodobacter sp. alg1]|uniref:HAD-IIB family hydrolase n=1 Tax=Falsirhodobacter sp. alg1 TaxID=1472418 RepID=UPI0005F00E2F|nr:HAD-IIB family hydrolase [Falsirhodobacter sp. alg1]
MHIMHIAIGGCLRTPPIQYGLTEDTGGHIAYILGAAHGQAARKDVSRVDIVTRSFNTFGSDYMQPVEAVTDRLRILRLSTDRQDYLTKDALWAEVPELADALSELLRTTSKPDVLHAHFADAAEIAFAVGAKFGIPVVYTPHSLALGKQGGQQEHRRLAAEHKAIAQADAIIASSRDEIEAQIPAYDPAAITRCHRIAPGASTFASTSDTAAADHLLHGLLDDPQKPIILAIARPVTKKNLRALALAYAGNPRLRDAANLVILAGQHATAEPEAKAILHELRDIAASLPGTFALPPSHNTQQVAALYRRAAETGGVFVNPALFEPFGLTLLEAAQAGLPVVATRHGGPSTILEQLDHGILVEPKDTDAIADACLTLVDDRDAWHRASANALRGIKEFDWTRYAEDSVLVYRGLRRAARPVPHQAKRLLACDIDNTLTGCAPSARRFAAWAESAHIPFAVATGRSLPEARAVLRRWNLPEPDAFITSVGTEIFLRGTKGLHLCPEYDAALATSWDRGAIQDVIAALHPEWQAQVDQRAHKISLFGSTDMAARVRTALRMAGHRAHVVHSHGRLIDILPPAGGKANAIAHLAGRFNLTLADCIAAGDSGNDLDMLTRCGTAIVVANASEELTGLRPRPGLVRTRQPFARGVLEGLEGVL